MSLGSRVGNAPPPRGAGAFLNHGDYLIVIRALKTFVSQNPKTRGNQMVVIEGQIAEVLVQLPEIPKSETSPYYGPSNPAGEIVSVIYNVDKNEFAISDVRGLMGAACGFDPHDPSITAEQWAKAVDKAVEGAGTTLAGAVVRATGVANTLKNGNPFVKVMWAGVDDATEQRAIVALKAA
jgi:hypothetical protein